MELFSLMTMGTIGFRNSRGQWQILTTSDKVNLISVVFCKVGMVHGWSVLWIKPPMEWAAVQSQAGVFLKDSGEGKSS